MPALDVMDNSSSGSAATSESAKSVKALDELLSKLTVSKSQDEASAAANNLASFINGATEEHEAPTKWVSAPRSRSSCYA
jgi:elongation factor 3